MGVSKVIFYDEVLVDMTQVTVTPETLGKGAMALNSKGDLITGTHECEETEPKLQEKTVTPTTSLQTVNPDSGYDGLSKVTVNAMPTATQATPSITVSSSGLITASATQSAGYVPAGTKSATKQLTTQAAKTVTPSTSSQTAVAKDIYTTGVVTVAAIPSSYVQPSGTKSITANGTHDVKSYANVSVNVAGEDVTAETNQYTSLLTSLESTIFSLPDAGSGGGVQVCTVTLVLNEVRADYIYKNNNGWNDELSNLIDTTTEIALSVAKGSVIFISAADSTGNNVSETYSSGIDWVYGDGYTYLFEISDDGTISLESATPALPWG